MKYIAVVRGKLKAKDEKQAQKIHDEIVAKISPMTKPMGATGHQPYLSVKNRNEFLAIDVWNNLESLQKLFGDPNFGAQLADFFDGQPDVTVWEDTGWSQF